MLHNLTGHIKTVFHHKWEVFKLSLLAGIPWRGLVHDLSKFSPQEFILSVKYYAGGTKSPISLQKLDEGYSTVWLHHKGRNKHHPEYWYDPIARQATPIIPFIYVCEMICDQLAAGKVYEGKTWHKEHQLEYWTKQRDKLPLQESLKSMLDELYGQVAQKGIKPVIYKENLKKLYDFYTAQQTETTSQQIV